MARYALVRNSDGLVRNVVEIESAGDYSPPAGHKVVADASSTAEVGGRWDGSTFAPAPAPAPPDPQIAADRTLVQQFMSAASGSATAAQRDDVTKAIVRYLRRMGQDA